MRYLLKQKMWSLGHDYTITDENGAVAFVVKGKVFSWGDKLSLMDGAGNEVVYIEQKVLSWGPTYQLYSGGELAAVVKEELFTFFHTAFDVDAAPIGPSGNDMVATGDVMSWNYSFARGGREVARVSTKFFRMTDTYGVEIAEGEDAGLVLAAAIIIDRCAQRKRERHG
ncbi:MAG: LURP-one-related/scramblase family protein [Phycisphaerae bacterium]